MILWLDSYSVKPPVNRSYKPVSHFINSINWWRLLGFLLCLLSAAATIAAIGYAINCGTGVVR